jgi:hypothetical protein
VRGREREVGEDESFELNLTIKRLLELPESELSPEVTGSNFTFDLC